MQNFSLINVPCPHCGTTVFTQKYLVKDTWKIVQCNNCAFVYTNPRLTQADIIKIYNQNYFHNNQFGYNNYEDNPHLKQLNFKKWIDEALPYLSNKDGILALDVGCAVGFALSHYEDCRIASEGLELDSTYVNALRRQNIKVWDKPLLENEFNKKFDIISMFDVVEHLTELDKHFDLLHQITNEYGLLVIVTPDYDSFQRKLFGEKWFQFKPIEHINYFTKNTLESLANRHGFELLICKKSGQYADAQFVADRLQKYNMPKIVKPLLWPIIAFIKLFKKPFYLDSASIYAVFRKK